MANTFFIQWGDEVWEQLRVDVNCDPSIPGTFPDHPPNTTCPYNGIHWGGDTGHALEIHTTSPEPFVRMKLHKSWAEGGDYLPFYIVVDSYPAGPANNMGVVYVPKHAHLGATAVPLVQFLPPEPLTDPPSPMGLDRAYPPTSGPRTTSSGQSIAYTVHPNLSGGGPLGGQIGLPSYFMPEDDYSPVWHIGFTHLIEGKIVVINFIYTSCPDTCPLETAQLVKVQEILGARLGKDLFFYSISLDPETDTPAVLRDYKERFGARWTFLTGDLNDVWDVQRKLGLFLEEIRDGLENHNVSMIIGNQATGRWMKRSPFENPHVLADQIGNWLDGWKRPPGLDDYVNAPKLRDLPRGEQLFRTRCASCHTVTGVEPERALGPDLLGVTRRRQPQWLLRWLQAPDRMLAERDPIAIALFEAYNRLPMPNLRLNKEEALDLINYLKGETARLIGQAPRPKPESTGDGTVASANASAGPAEESDGALEITNAWIRAAHPASKTTAGYLTLANHGPVDRVLTRVTGSAFGHVDIVEVTEVDGLVRRGPVETVEIPAGDRVELKPGGLRLLLRDRLQDIEPEDEIDLMLTFQSGAQRRVVFQVAESR